mgnify:FL=1
MGDVVLWLDENLGGRPAIVMEVHTPDRPDSILNLFVMTVQQQFVMTNVLAGETTGCWKRKAGWQT